MNQQTKYPLREKRKRRTRNALINAAAALFYEQGYEETTLEEVAERAEVHVQTLYRHFPTKEALALAPDRKVFEDFCVVALDPAREVDTLTMWRNWVDAQSQSVTSRFGKQYLKRARSRELVPALAVASLRLWHEYEDVLTQAIASDMRVDPQKVRLPRILACTLWGAHQHAVRTWAQSKGSLDLAKETVAVVDEVKSLFGDYVARGTKPSSSRSRTKTRKKE
ncbi:MAG: TetR/AcrR family transcriptional regulator [Pseudomonadales bacterium]